MNILNCFAGLGGNRRLWENHTVTAIEKDEGIANIYKKRFPADKLIVGDVFEYLRDKTYDIDRFDFIWASPPCQTHSQMQKFNPSKTKRQPFPELTQIYGLMFWLNQNYKNKYCIENVQPFYKAPIDPTIRLDRHLFWANFPIKPNSELTERGNNKHGKIGGVMRDDGHNNLVEYAKFMKLDDVIDDIFALKGYNHAQLIRNTIHGEIGKYILDELIHMHVNNSVSKKQSLL